MQQIYLANIEEEASSADNSGEKSISFAMLKKLELDS